MQAEQSVARLIALASEIKLSSTVVEAQTLTAGVNAELLQIAASYIDLRADLEFSVLSVAAQAAVMQADVVVGDFIKFLSFLESVDSLDQHTKAVAKNLSDLLSATDQAAVNFGKPVAETVAIADAKIISVGKAPNESVTAAESHAKTTSKVATDAAATADTTLLTTAKTVTDRIYQLEGPYFAQTYVDPTYLAEDYVWDGGPVIDFGKAVTEILTTSDVLTKVSQFGRSFDEAKSATDSAAKTFTKSAITDSASASDTFAKTASKSFAEAIANSEIVVRSVGKVLAESKTASASGNFRMTDYTDIGYFAEDYIGTSVNF